MKTTQAEAWAGSMGDQYTDRNEVAWHKRIPFWQAIMQHPLVAQPEICRILEVGCNAGWNLNALRSISPYYDLWGADVNRHALERARAAGHRHLMNCEAADLHTYFGDGSFDLVFTAGVLIHVPPTQLFNVMYAIAQASLRWVVAVEYNSHSGLEEEVEYRGMSRMLWRRDFGELYLRLGLDMIATGDAGDGFDRCTYWLMRKRK